RGDRSAGRDPGPVTTGGPSSGGAAGGRGLAIAAMALATWIAAGAAQSSAPALGDKPPKPAPVQRAPHAPSEAGLSPAALAAAAEACVAARPLAGKEWLILAVCAGHDGDLEASRRAASAAVDLDPTLPEAQYLHGLLAWRDGRRAEAQDRFRTAIALDSTYRE